MKDKRISMDDFKSGTPGEKLQEFKEAVRQMTLTLPVQLEMMAIQAKLIRAKYNALVAEGFTEQQALELCKGM